jgi:hypothetical protein
MIVVVECESCVCFLLFALASCQKIKENISGVLLALRRIEASENKREYMYSIGTGKDWFAHRVQEWQQDALTIVRGQTMKENISGVLLALRRIEAQGPSVSCLAGCIQYCQSLGSIQYCQSLGSIQYYQSLGRSRTQQFVHRFFYRDWKLLCTICVDTNKFFLLGVDITKL